MLNKTKNRCCSHRPFANLRDSYHRKTNKCLVIRAKGALRIYNLGIYFLLRWVREEVPEKVMFELRYDENG